MTPLSNHLFYDRAAASMASLTAQAERLNTQISRASNVLSASDDSLAYQRLQGLGREDANAIVGSANLKIAQSVLQQADSTLASLTEQLQSAQQFAVQAGDGTLSPDARTALAAQLAGILDSIVALANTKDVRDGPLFGGATDAAAVTKAADGSLVFTDGEAAAIPIGDGQTVQPSSNARNFLTVGDGDIGTVLTAMIAALNAGDALPAGAADALTAISDQTIAAQSSLGARAARVDLVAAQMITASEDRAATSSAIDGFDLATNYTKLQEALTVLQATQQSFSKLSALSLFDYLR